MGSDSIDSVLIYDFSIESDPIDLTRNYNQYLGESGWDLKLSERLHAEASRLKSNTNIKTGVVADAFALADLALLKIYLNKREEDPQKAADFIVNIDFGGAIQNRAANWSMANKFKDAIKPGVITIGGNTDLRVEALLEANATVKNQAKKSIEAYTEAVDYYYQEQIYQAPLALKEALASYLAAIKQNEYALHSPENQLENINTHAQYIVEQIEHPHEKPATQEAIQY